MMSRSAVQSRWSARDLTRMAVCAVLTAVCSWISVPAAVPFTLQTFAVFLTISLLGGRQGTVSVLVYLLLGAVGLPVFSGFSGGIGGLLGSTGGYLVGFLLIGLSDWLLTALLGEKLPVRIAAMLIGLLLCYAFGTLWFMRVYTRTSGPIGLMTALGWCVFPFLLPDFIKMALAILLAGQLRPRIH